MPNHHRRAAAATAPAAALALTASLALACASLPPPTQTLAQAELAVREAEQANAREHASLELYQATEKLQTARRAMANEDYVIARRLAEEALVQAQLAEQKAQTARAEQTAQELEETIAALRYQTGRTVDAQERELERYGEDLDADTGAATGGTLR